MFQNRLVFSPEKTDPGIFSTTDSTTTCGCFFPKGGDHSNHDLEQPLMDRFGDVFFFGLDGRFGGGCCQRFC